MKNMRANKKSHKSTGSFDLQKREFVEHLCKSLLKNILFREGEQILSKHNFLLKMVKELLILLNTLKVALKVGLEIRVGRIE